MSNLDTTLQHRWRLYSLSYPFKSLFSRSSDIVVQFSFQHIGGRFGDCLDVGFRFLPSCQP